ncbi:MAG: ATP-grasp domain-containing protein [Betaproteobacteria bacterium]|nr:ATP-grasp domain-containing protein [Betaproteobacteria bacterium]MDH4326654.1 ATP-grasp domain-containing protein [Betaproteobacteria bacterium]MDH5210795.1 ATP-grasp domain-containing protein [Betaproteobacteria bacterium]MDH5577928.1 ATP-grasp domain-containing protein [Betaproteobacteria bacterium]
MKKILVLFPKEWDRLEFERPEYRGRYEFVYAGFDLFRFPQNAQLATFDVFRFVNRLLERFRKERLDGVISNNEHFGAPIAAVLAEKLGLPGNDPRVVITAQHKFYARQAFAQIAPEAAARCAVFPYALRRREDLPFELPCFVKPVRATYSVLARRVERFDELQRHLAFWPFEKWVIKRLVKPFNDLMRWYTDYALDAHHLIAEEILPGVQVNMDGYVHEGSVHVLGVVDENMYPGTSAFCSFEYPSRVPAEAQAKMTALAAKLLAGMGYRHGFFNLEFSWDPASGRIAVIELNPRMASQLSYVYECVDGVRPYEALLALATGDAPPAIAVASRFSHAASFALRKFDGRPLAAHPTAEQLARARHEFPEAQLMLYLKRGASLTREMKWLGSYRYAVVNMAATSQQALYERFRAFARRLFLTSDLPA